jgi:hypothetical protein
MDSQPGRPACGPRLAGRTATLSPRQRGQRATANRTLGLHSAPPNPRYFGRACLPPSPASPPPLRLHEPCPGWHQAGEGRRARLQLGRSYTRALFRRSPSLPDLACAGTPRTGLARQVLRALLLARPPLILYLAGEGRRARLVRVVAAGERPQAAASSRGEGLRDSGPGWRDPATCGLRLQAAASSDAFAPSLAGLAL